MSLVSLPPTNGSFCPEAEVDFRCKAINISNVFEWLINGSSASTFVITDNEIKPPLPLSLTMSAPECAEAVISFANVDSNSLLNITSTLRGTFACLQGSTVECGAVFLTSARYYVKARGKPLAELH